jgi:hypothetical protein
MGREQEVTHPAVSHLNFFDNAVSICSELQRHYRLKSKRNRNANVGDRSARPGWILENVQN